MRPEDNRNNDAGRESKRKSVVEIAKFRVSRNPPSLSTVDFAF